MLRATADSASATYFFVTDQRSTDRTVASLAPLGSLTISGEPAKVVYGEPSVGRTRRR